MVADRVILDEACFRSRRRHCTWARALGHGTSSGVNASIRCGCRMLHVTGAAGDLLAGCLASCAVLFVHI